MNTAEAGGIDIILAVMATALKIITSTIVSFTINNRFVYNQLSFLFPNIMKLAVALLLVAVIAGQGVDGKCELQGERGRRLITLVGVGKKPWNIHSNANIKYTCILHNNNSHYLTCSKV